MNTGRDKENEFSNRLKIQRKISLNKEENENLISVFVVKVEREYGRSEIINVHNHRMKTIELLKHDVVSIQFSKTVTTNNCLLQSN
ncbi:CLUMA_CG004348, isoform A [Clunio marinus]|uniref:CLUMA_CG004348, isoform A n=1 Tax=Clunio marinus TaxID=568069 RepID=A0A1J1HRH2_9DIPT|nr:CLUMA_CG004348, isoform A [Clunio marinus]